MAAIENSIKNEASEIAEVTGNIHLFPDREAMIAELAYYKAEKRGFLPGYELENWLESEKELGL